MQLQDFDECKHPIPGQLHIAEEDGDTWRREGGSHKRACVVRVVSQVGCVGVNVMALYPDHQGTLK